MPEAQELLLELTLPVPDTVRLELRELLGLPEAEGLKQLLALKLTLPLTTGEAEGLMEADLDLEPELV